jgi:sulfide:quinone oxidoreductase
MPAHQPYRVLVAGGGPAALEAAFALQRIAGDRVSTTVLAPDREFVPRAMSVLEPFAAGGPEHRSLAGMVADAGAELRPGVLASVDHAHHRVRTEAGEIIPYDALLVAVGAVGHAPYDHALTFGAPGSQELMHGLVQDVEAGYARRVAFVVPTGSTWPLPVYELALMTAQRAWESGVTAELTLVTPEPAPLALFGPEASRGVAGLLEAAGVTLSTGTHADVGEAHDITLRPSGERLELDRVVTIPVLDGPAIEGLPHDAAGFIAIDSNSRALGVDDVYAAGDGANFPIKQGGLACQQADAAADAIAAAAGVEVDPEPFRPVLRGVLLTERHQRWMQRDASGTSGDPSTSSVPPLWWPPTKIAGRELSRHLADVHVRPRHEDRAGVEVELLVGAN